MSIYKFRNCYLNTVERRVTKDGNYLELTPKTFDVLQLLIENCGEIVTKDEILGKVWNGSFVEEGNLPVHISKLRRSLDETKNEPFIETVPGSGYRFISPVQTVGKDEWRKHLPDKNHLETEKTSDEFTFDSIAVLPLHNESNNPEIEYVADGLTEGFINNLSRLSNLKVIARNTVFRYKNKDADAREVGETLGVSTVLTGRIKVIKENLIISVELINVINDTQIWGTQYNQPFSEIIKIQEEIISAVSEKLRTEIDYVARNSATKPYTQNSESYRLYLKGKYFLEKWTVDDIYKAIECFQKSISYDPINVLSYVEIIECYFLLYFSDYISFSNVLVKIKPFLIFVSELNQHIDVIQAMYGGKKMYLEWKFSESENYFREALNLNPNCLIAHYRYSALLLLSGRFSEALKELQQIMLIDPLSLLNYKRIGRLFYKMEQYENAISYLKDVLDLEPTDYIALAILGAALTELGNYKEAMAIFQKSLIIHYNVETLSMIGYVHAREGNKDDAIQIIRQIKAQSKGNRHHAIKLARIYLALEDDEMAYKFLEQAFKQHDVDLISITSDPRWSSIRKDQKFQELVRKVGLPIIKENKFR